MNYKMTGHMLGIIIVVLAGLLLIPFVIAIALKESTILSFGLTIIIMLLVGLPFAFFKPKNTRIQSKEGFVIVALAWLIVSAFGSLPYFLSKAIPNFVDAFFETVSGFTTTGATILKDVESLPKSLLFWRSFSQWIGGMGVLVFLIAILPKSNAQGIHIFRAESPGPQVGKLVSKLRFTAQILYAIYIVLTIVQIILLSFKLPIFDSIMYAFSTASTGGFSIKNTNLTAYDSIYVEAIITVFMVIFSINFNIYFLILLGKLKSALKSEELQALFIILAFSITAISLSLYFNQIYKTFGESFRHSAFQATSTMSTSGFVSQDYSMWPAFAQFVLFFLMFIGGSANSTAGGLKISRFLILFKSGLRELRRSASPRSVNIIMLDGKPLDYTVSHSTMRYFMLYIIVIVTSTLLISVSNPNNFLSDSFAVYFSSAVSCINNVGPYMGAMGYIGNYFSFSSFSKIVLSITMLIGRLEILPMIMLFYPKFWSKK